MKKYFLIMMIGILSGCTTQAVKLPETWVYTGDDAVTLVALVGIAKAGVHRSMLPYHFFTIENDALEQSLNVKADYDPGFMNSVKDYENDEGKFGIVMFKLKPGDYRITRIQSYSPSPYGGVTLSNEVEFSIPLTFSAGEKYYLGTFTAHNVAGKGVLGNKLVVGAYWTTDTVSLPDIQAISEKYPELKGVTLKPYTDSIEYIPFFFSSKEKALKIFGTTNN